MNETVDCKIAKCVGNQTLMSGDLDSVTYLQNEQPREKINVPVIDTLPLQTLHVPNISNRRSTTPVTDTKLSRTVPSVVHEKSLSDNVNSLSSTQLSNIKKTYSMSYEGKQAVTTEAVNKEDSEVTKIKANETDSGLSDVLHIETTTYSTSPKTLEKTFPLSTAIVTHSGNIFKTVSNTTVQLQVTLSGITGKQRTSSVSASTMGVSTTKFTTEHDRSTSVLSKFTTSSQRTPISLQNSAVKYIQPEKSTYESPDIKELRNSTKASAVNSTTITKLIDIINKDTTTPKSLSNMSILAIPGNLTKETLPSNTETKYSSQLTKSTNKAIYALPVLLVAIVLLIVFIIFIYAKKKEKHRGKQLLNASPDYVENEYHDKDVYSKAGLTNQNSKHSSAILEELIPLKSVILDGAADKHKKTSNVCKDTPQTSEANVAENFVDNEIYEGVNNTTNDSTETTRNQTPTSIISLSHDYQSVPSTSAAPIMQPLSICNGQVINITEYLIPACHSHPSQGPNWRPHHDYDPVYVPTSSASAMNRLVDSTGYVSRPRPDSPILEVYEEINYGAVAAPPLRPRCTMGATASGGRPSRNLPVPPPPIPPHQPRNNNDNNVHHLYSLPPPVRTVETGTTQTDQNSLNVSIPVANSSRSGYATMTAGDSGVTSRISCASSTSRDEQYESVDLLKYDS